MVRQYIFAAFFALASIAAFSSPLRAASADSRQQINAFVVGLSYAGAPEGFRLHTTLADASEMATFLKSAPQRKVMFVENPDINAFEAALQTYFDGLQKSDTALIYYAGHGIQIDGTNYMVSGDGGALIPVGDIVAEARKRAKVVLLFLDACRDNPFVAQKAVGGGTTRSISVSALGTRGLQRMSEAEKKGGGGINSIPLSQPNLTSTNGLAQFRLQGRGVKIIFSTDPGNVALDAVGSSSHSPFAKSLVKSLTQAKSLDEVLADVTRDVVQDTGGRQTPWVQGSLEESIFISGKPKRYDNRDVVMPLP